MGLKIWTYKQNLFNQFWKKIHVYLFTYSSREFCMDSLFLLMRYTSSLIVFLDKGALMYDMKDRILMPQENMDGLVPGMGFVHSRQKHIHLD